MLKRVVWEKDSVYSLKLRDNLYTLIQMRENSLMQFFDMSNSTNHWDGINLNEKKTLFFVFAAENRLKSLFVEKISTSVVVPSSEPVRMTMLSTVFGTGGAVGANLIHLTPTYSSVGATIIKSNLTIENDLELIYKNELAGMIGDPEKLRSRLLRYFESGVNWDESKSFVFKGIQPPPSSN